MKQARGHHGKLSQRGVLVGPVPVPVVIVNEPVAAIDWRARVVPSRARLVVTKPLLWKSLVPDQASTAMLARAPMPALMRSRLLTLSAAVPLTTVSTTVIPGDIIVRDHTLRVPLSHVAPQPGEEIDVFVREMTPASKAEDDSPYLLYLQGGPGFPSPRPEAPPAGWPAAALKAGYRVLLLDQRGTGRSSPVTAQSLGALEDAAAQASYLEHFRADSIVGDCEIVRQQICAGKKLTLLGQSFGGFCIANYLSTAPEGVERALCTVGLPPIGRTADEVYRATFRRMEERNRRYYERYPQDVELVREIVRSLHERPRPLPRGGTLTARRLLQLGIALGRSTGFETLHDTFELARCPAPDGGLPQHFLLAVEDAQSDFETNPIYWLLHEAIYCDGPGCGASSWAAERVQASLGDDWDYTTRLDAGGPPVQLTGEHVYSWMSEDYAWLRPLKGAAELLAAKSDWPPLYDPPTLASAKCPPVAALVAYGDPYVERAFSEGAAALLGPGGRTARLWVTNEFQHNGLRAEGEVVFKRLLAMAKGELAIPA